MPTILLATATSLLFGCSDFFGGLASRRASAITVTANAHTLGILLLGAATLLFPAQFGSRDIWWGVAAGISGAVGVTALYAGLAAGRMGVVAPIAACLSGSLPAVYDLLRGTSVRPLSLAGLGIALLATVVVSASGGSEDRAGMPPRAIGLAVLAGVGFTGSFIFFSLAGSDSGLMPLFAARVTSASVLVVATVAGGRPLTVSRETVSPTLAAGTLDAAANIAMISAIRIGPLAVASVLGSLYPVVTILLARVVLGERLKAIQRVGVALALAALILTSLR